MAVDVVDVKDPSAVTDIRKKELISDGGLVKEQRPEPPVPMEDTSSPDAKCEENPETPRPAGMEAVDIFDKEPDTAAGSKSEENLSEGFLEKEQNSNRPALAEDTSCRDEKCEQSPETPLKAGMEPADSESEP